MIPEALANNNPKKDTWVAARRVSGKVYDTVYMLDKREVTSGNTDVEFIGNYESIVEQLLAANPPVATGCTTVTIHRYQTDHLTVWHKPYYTGSDEDVVLHLLQKYGEVYVPEAAMRANLRRQFPFIASDGDKRLFLPDHVLLKRKVANTTDKSERVRQRRIAAGNVTNNDVKWLYWQFYNGLSREIRPAGVDLRMYMGSRFKTNYMHSTIAMVKLLRKLGALGKRRNVCDAKVYLKRLVPFLPGLLKHPDKGYRSYGKCLESVLRQLRIK